MKTKISGKKFLKKYSIISIGGILYAVGIGLFLDPNNLAPGGISGISIMLNRFVPIETGTIILLLNIPILLIGLWKLGRTVLIPTFYAIALTSVLINVLSPIGALTTEPILAALAGGALVAAGIGSIFLAGATTGGVDIIVRLLRIKYPYIKTGKLFFSLDAVVVSVSGFVFQNVDSALYAAIAAICCAIVMDIVLYGTDEAKLIYIISDYADMITNRLLADLDIGVTHLDGRGAYSSKEKQVIMCVTKKQQSPKVEEIVKKCDKDAFMIISSASEIFGEGYKNIFAERI